MCKLNIISYVDFSKFHQINDSSCTAVLKMNNTIVPLLANDFMTEDSIDLDIFKKKINLNDCQHNFVHIYNSQCRGGDEAFSSFYRCTLCLKIIIKS